MSDVNIEHLCTALSLDELPPIITAITNFAVAVERLKQRATELESAFNHIGPRADAEDQAVLNAARRHYGHIIRAVLLEANK